MYKCARKRKSLSLFFLFHESYYHFCMFSDIVSSVISLERKKMKKKGRQAMGRLSVCWSMHDQHFFFLFFFFTLRPDGYQHRVKQSRQNTQDSQSTAALAVAWLAQLVSPSCYHHVRVRVQKVVGHQTDIFGLKWDPALIRMSAVPH